MLLRNLKCNYSCRFFNFPNIMQGLGHGGVGLYFMLDFIILFISNIIILTYLPVKECMKNLISSFVKYLLVLNSD